MESFLENCYRFDWFILFVLFVCFCLFFFISKWWCIIFKRDYIPISVFLSCLLSFLSFIQSLNWEQIKHNRFIVTCSVKSWNVTLRWRHIDARETTGIVTGQRHVAVKCRFFMDNFTGTAKWFWRAKCLSISSQQTKMSERMRTENRVNECY